MDEWDEGLESELGTTTLRGRMLVASPVLGDPNFERTVVLLIEHGPEGALGLVLNRPSEMPLDEVLPQWDSRAAAPRSVFIGGPVQPNGVICLARADGQPTSGDDQEPLTATAVPGISLLDLDSDRDRLHPDLSLRCFAGYAGWSEGQLEAEIDEGSWFVVDPLPEDPFVDEPRHLWRSVLARQPGSLARYARYPLDPSVN